MPKVTVNSIGEYIREQREQAKISMRQLAQSAGVSNPYLSQIERGLRKPSADILQQLAKGLRISAEALYVQAGILEDRPPDSGVRSALLADPQLSERQKQVLLEIYESFRRENAGGQDADAVIDPAELAAGAPGADAEAAAVEARAEAAVMEAEAREAAHAEAAEEAAQTEAGQTEAGQTDAGRAKPARSKTARAGAAWAEAVRAEAAEPRAAAAEPAAETGPAPEDVPPIRPSSASD